MNLLSLIALALLTLVGYSAGVTAVGRWRSIAPTIWDLLLVAAIWVAAFMLRGALGHWLAVAAALVVAGIVGGMVTAVRHGQTPRAVPLRQTFDNPLRQLWERWQAFAADMGNYQGRLLMGFFYFVVVTPFGLVMRFAGDPLRLRPLPAQSGWQAKEPMAHTIEEGRRQG